MQSTSTPAPPSSAFTATTLDLDAFCSQGHSPALYGNFTVVRQSGTRYNMRYDGWILPETPQGVTYLAGWFQGRRSEGARKWVKKRFKANGA